MRNPGNVGTREANWLSLIVVTQLIKHSIISNNWFEI